MLLALWNLGNVTARSSTAFLRGRLFHACNVNHTPSHKDPVKYRELLDRKNAARRLRRLENPVEHRESLDRRNAARRLKCLEDPIKYKNQQRTHWGDHYHGNPENAKKQSERNKRPEVKERYRLFRENSAFKQTESLRKFIVRRPHIWRHLEWKTHTPILYDTKTKHACATCYSDPYQGYKLWWKRHDNPDHNPDHSPDIYDCHACFVADWSRALPIGYENFDFGQGKRFRLRDRAGSATKASDLKEKGR